MDAEQEIYIARRFRRRALVGVVISILGLAGLTVGIYALQQIKPQPMVELDRTHPSCPHTECKVPHPGAKKPEFPDGTGTGLLVAAYLTLCAGSCYHMMKD